MSTNSVGDETVNGTKQLLPKLDITAPRRIDGAITRWCALCDSSW